MPLEKLDLKTASTKVYVELKQGKNQCVLQKYWSGG